MSAPDADLLLGAWQVMKAELAGEEMPAFVADKIQLEFTPGRYVVRFSGQVSDAGDCEVDATAQPKALILRGREGTNAGRAIPAIYQLVGDRLRICYGLDGVTPTAFTTAPGQNLFLATYRRTRPSL